MSKGLIYTGSILSALLGTIFFSNYSSPHLLHADSAMHGMYGIYPMARDSSGTSWLPSSNHMPFIEWQVDEWMYMAHGWMFGIYDHQKGPQGGKKSFSENMLMVTTQKDYGGAIAAFRGMMCLEPGTIGARGYPLLLQTGETANGVTPLVNRQHPHDMLMELAVVGTKKFSDSSLFLYFGMPGEPALGPTVYMMRFSGFYNPEAPITHHWLDSTHITFGVATIGFVHDLFKIDASIFTGREPDQHRWNFDRPRFDSYSIRFTINPTEDIAMQASYGYLKSPEQLAPNINVGRATASISYNKAWQLHNWQTLAAWGRNHEYSKHVSNGYLLESTIELNGRHVIFGRGEYVAKDGLFLPPDPRAEIWYKVGKIDAGYMIHHAFPFLPHVKWGVGGVGSFSFVPSSIKAAYGGTPFSYMFFLRAGLA